MMFRAPHLWFALLAWCQGLGSPWLQAEEPVLLGSPARGKPAAPVLGGSVLTSQRNSFMRTFDSAVGAQRQKDFQSALAGFERALAGASLRENPMGWLTTQFNICHTLNLMGRRAQAAARARAVVEECERVCGSADPATSEALSHLAFVLKQHGRLADAEPVYRRNVEVLEERYGPDSYQVAEAVCRHGSLLQSLGRFQEAERQHRRALALATTHDVGDPVILAFYITHLAHGLHVSGKKLEAGQLMELAYEVVHQVPDSSIHLGGGSILRKQAEYFRDTRQLDRAEELGRRALARVARRPEVHKVRFFYYDVTLELYRSILRQMGEPEAEIQAVVRQVEDEAASTPETASTSVLP